MRKRLRAAPKFKNEAVERAFREASENDGTQYLDWNKVKLTEFRNLRPSTQTISLRLPKDLLATIRGQARRMDIPYQSRMKLWLTEKAAGGFKPHAAKKAG